MSDLMVFTSIFCRTYSQFYTSFPSFRKMQPLIVQGLGLGLNHWYGLYDDSFKVYVHLTNNLLLSPRIWRPCLKRNLQFKAESQHFNPKVSVSFQIKCAYLHKHNLFLLPLMPIKSLNPLMNLSTVRSYSCWQNDCKIMDGAVYPCKLFFMFREIVEVKHFHSSSYF